MRELQALIAVYENDFKLSDASAHLHLVQSAVSQQISRLESGLGVSLLNRNGKRIVGLSVAGELILEHAYYILSHSENIKTIAMEHSEQGVNALRIAATHSQAKYVMPDVVTRFMQQYPEVMLTIKQGSPTQLVEMLRRDEVDISICTEALANDPDIHSIDSYVWNRVLICPPSHPLAQLDQLTLEDIASQPIITYTAGFTGSGAFTQAFNQRGLQLNVVLSAADSDVIKAYVRQGLGVGVIASMASQPAMDSDLHHQDLGGLFEGEVAKVAHLKTKYMPAIYEAFIEQFQSHVTKTFGPLPVK